MKERVISYGVKAVNIRLAVISVCSKARVSIAERRLFLNNRRSNSIGQNLVMSAVLGVYVLFVSAEDGLECASNPCKNGGQCLEDTLSYTCNCTKYYLGTHCEGIIFSRLHKNFLQLARHFVRQTWGPSSTFPPLFILLSPGHFQNTQRFPA